MGFGPVGVPMKDKLSRALTHLLSLKIFWSWVRFPRVSKAPDQKMQKINSHAKSSTRDLIKLLATGETEA